MSSEEKLLAMENFRSGKTQVLVATSIVEVGIDVPNLTVMVIENAERFGLAALHQLRGRVGRGAHSGYVGVFAAPTTEEAKRASRHSSKPKTASSLAERDFQLRGPGDLFGTRQHGLPPLRIADLQGDTELLDETRGVARAIIEQDPDSSDRLTPNYGAKRWRATAKCSIWETWASNSCPLNYRLQAAANLQAG